MNTSKSKVIPKVGDGKCYKLMKPTMQKFLGKLVKVETIQRPFSFDYSVTHHFEKRKVNDDDIAFVVEHPCEGNKPKETGKKSVNMPGYASAKTAPAAPSFNGNAKVGDGKCYQHNGVYLGKLTKLGVSGREQILTYVFEKKTISSEDLSNSKKIEAVECKTNTTGGRRKTKKNRNRKNRQTRRN